MFDYCIDWGKRVMEGKQTSFKWHHLYAHLAIKSSSSTQDF